MDRTFVVLLLGFGIVAGVVEIVKDLRKPNIVIQIPTDCARVMSKGIVNLPNGKSIKVAPGQYKCDGVVTAEWREHEK